MSQRRESADGFDIGSALTELREWYHIPTLGLLMAFMLWVRTRGWSRFLRNGEVMLSGNDAWYHLRQTTYTVNNWPATMPFDTWTYFAKGTSSGQFGTIFDQLIATTALIVGLGNPSQQTIAMTVLFAPAVFGTIVAIPVYLAGKRLGGRFGGLVSVLVLALSSGGFLRRALVGFSDHHVGELLFQMIAVLAIMVALSVAQRDRPVWELVENREWDGLRQPVGWSALAGVAIALYLWTWPPGVLLLGILGIFFLIQLSADVVRGHSPDHIAFVGVVSLGVAGLLSFVPFNTFEVTATNFSLLQPLMALGVAAGCVFLAWFAREFEARGITPNAYPLAVFGILAATVVVVNLVAPDLYGFFANNVERVVGLGTSAEGGTVGEVQPLTQPVQSFISIYGLTFVIAFVSLLVIVYTQIRDSDADAELLFVTVWAIILLFATLTQARFQYYFALPVAVLNAYFISLVSKYVTTDTDEGIETFQLLTVATVLILIVAPLAVVSVQAQGQGQQQKKLKPKSLHSAEANAPSPGVIGWEDSLSWLGENTPTPGTYGGADNGMDFNGTVKRQDDYDYPEGAYGVISWWDYGHWITQRAQRIPTANPFQQGATEAANFLLAPNETQAADVFSEIDEDDAKTRYVMVDWKMVNSRSRYGGKFFAPIVFYDNADLSQSQFFKDVWSARSIQQRSPRKAYQVKTQRYYESMVNRLWYFHGSAKKPSPVMINYSTRTVGDGTIYTTPQTDRTRYKLPDRRVSTWFFRVDRGNVSNETLAQLRQLAVRDAREASVDQLQRQAANLTTAQVGGVGPNPPEYVEALEQYRLVRSGTRAATTGRGYLGSTRANNRGLIADRLGNATNESRQGLLRDLNRLFPGQTNAPWVKTFERVPGGTITGTGPANRTITAEVQVRSPTRNGTFTYTQQAETGPDGEFSMTVPYSTTGYDNWGPQEGYTNVSARAVSDYRLYTTNITEDAVFQHTANATVTEAQVIGEDQSTTTVTLERKKLADLRRLFSDGNSQTIDLSNSTDSNTTVQNETAQSTSTNTTGTEPVESPNESTSPSIAAPRQARP